MDVAGDNPRPEPQTAGGFGEQDGEIPAGAGAILAVRAAMVAAGTGMDLRGLAHITGGGLPGNVPRALPNGLGARLDPTRWTMPSVMRLFGALGGLDDVELRATFDGGLGMVVVVPATAVATTCSAFGARGVEALLVGEVVEASAAEGPRYVEGRLESIA